MQDLQFTGERVVPDKMDAENITLKEHLARYEFVKKADLGKRILDAACGSGYGTKMLGATGLDVSAEAVEYAKEKYGVEAEVWDLEQGLNGKFYDTIVSFETIEHLENPDKFLKDAALATNQFIFSIPLNNPSKFHKKIYTLEQAQNLIYKHFSKVYWYEQNGLEISELHSDNPQFLIGVAGKGNQPKSDLIIVSHNSKKDLERFVPQIPKTTKNFTLTIVDNSDKEETKKYLENLNKDNKDIVVLNVENKGYGAACNVGAQNTKSEFIVFLNADLGVNMDWLDELLRPFNDKRVAVSGARLFSEGGTEYPTPEKDMVIGCVFAVRRSIFEELKGFDENYFLFFEETDYCKRAVDAGYRVVRSEAKVVHFHPHFNNEIQSDPFLKLNWDKSKKYYQNKFNVIYGQEKKPQGKRCLIGIRCGSGMMSAYAVDGLFKLTRPIPTSCLIIERQSADAAANYLVEVAIRMQVDYLFFVDDDGVLPSDALVKLMEDDKDIVGAPMMTRNVRDNGKHGLCCFEKFDFYIGDGKTIKKYRSLEKFDNSKGYLHQVDGVGLACVLIKREAFEPLFVKHNGRPFEFIHETHITKEHGVTLRNISEDMCFFERAKEEGFAIYVDTRVRPVHLGKPEFIRFEQEDEDSAKLGKLETPLKGTILLSENLKSLEK
jgi:GT2 family glycosyltransferase